MAEIWHTRPTLEVLSEHMSTNMLAHLDIQFTEIGDNFLKASMPVDHRTQQPYGILHGGASVVLAESLGSSAAALCVDMMVNKVVGLEINSNHIRSVRSGRVEGTARPIHIGRSTQVWEIRIENEEGKLVNISRLTMAVIPASQV